MEKIKNIFKTALSFYAAACAVCLILWVFGSIAAPRLMRVWLAYSFMFCFELWLCVCMLLGRFFAGRKNGAKHR